MAKSIADPFRKSEPKTCEVSASATSSRESSDGASLFGLQALQTTFLFGQEAVPVSRFRAPENNGVTKTNGTSGPNSSVSSASARLQSSLESRLVAALDLNGSPEYRLTWKMRAMPSGRQVLTLQARARRTSDNACTGWPTPRAQKHSPQSRDKSNLATDALLAGWRTPQESDGEGGVMEIRPNTTGHYKLRDEAVLAGWPTATTRDHKDGTATSCENVKDNALLGRVAHTAGGTVPTGTNAQTESSAGCRLNPRFSLWLMIGEKAEEWASCAEQATQSCRKSRRSSSERPSTP